MRETLKSKSGKRVKLKKKDLGSTKDNTRTYEDPEPTQRPQISPKKPSHINFIEEKALLNQQTQSALLSQNTESDH